MAKSMNEGLAKLDSLRRENLEGGGPEAIERQHTRGKLTARERIDLLVDPGTFSELGSSGRSTGIPMGGTVKKTPCDAAIIGTGKVHGRPITVYASDFTVLGGSMGGQHLVRLYKIMEWAGKWGIPFISLLDSSGGRLNESERLPTAGVHFWFEIESLISGVVPNINLLMGPCVAGQAYFPILSDFLLMTRGNGYMWLGGPRMTKAATSEETLLKREDVGSGDYHMRYSGSCHIVGESDEDLLRKARTLLSYLPQNYRERPPIVNTGDDPKRKVEELLHLLPDDVNQTYDMHDVITKIVDNGEFFEIQNEYAKQIIAGFCRFDGRSVGIVANNPAESGGSLENDACDKYCHFLRVLNAFNIPLVTLVDTPPIVPGEEWERKGLLRHGGKVIFDYATATIPKISVILRRAYMDAGGIVMPGSKEMGVDLCYAWPISELAIEVSKMDVAGKMSIDKDALSGYLQRARERIDVFEATRGFATGIVDEIIDPRDTRQRIIEALQVTENKQEKMPKRAKKHGAPPT